MRISFVALIPAALGCWLATIHPCRAEAPESPPAASRTGEPRVEIFTDRDHPLRNVEALPGAVVYRIDGLARAMEKISADLPADQASASDLASRRLARLDRQELAEAAQGLTLAWLQYRLDRYPAIVFDGRAVIYGVTDLALARRIHDEAMGARP